MMVNQCNSKSKDLQLELPIDLLVWQSMIKVLQNLAISCKSLLLHCHYHQFCCTKISNLLTRQQFQSNGHKLTTQQFQLPATFYKLLTLAHLFSEPFTMEQIDPVKDNLL